MALGTQDPVGGDCAPTYVLKVNNTEVSPAVRALIKSVEFESCDGLADVMKIVANDPLDETGLRVLSESKVFAPGNELTISFGYFGAVIENVGRALIRKQKPNFPQEGVPQLEVTAYSRDVLMMDNEPKPLRERKKPSKRKKAKHVDEFGKEIPDDGFKDSKAGRRFANQTYADAIISRAEDYGFIPDVDPTPDPPHDFIQKAGMKDYDFVKGLSNITGYYFWVAYDFDQVGWVLHFKNPETYVEPQEKEFNFKYAQGDYSTLLTFEPEMALQGSTIELYVEATDPLTGRDMSLQLEEPSEAAPDPIDTNSSGDQKLDKPYTTDVKIFLGEFSVEVRANRRFRDDNELQFWTQQWFRRQRENFIMASATTIGVETLKARQIHKISNVGVAYEGKYIFNKVRHIFNDNGYTCEVNMRKFIEPMPPLRGNG